MSDPGSDTAPSTETSLHLWQGLEFVLTHPRTSSLSATQDVDLADATLLPESARAHDALTVSKLSATKCRVPGCRIINCNLGTHQRFDPNPSKKRSRGSRQKIGGRAVAALKQLEAYGKMSIVNDAVDGFPKLPLEERLDPAIRCLFHFFFMSTFDKLALLFRGPSVINMHEFKERMLATALNSEAYCRSLILQARVEQDSAKGRCEETSETLALNNNLIKAFREQLVIIHRKPHPLQIELALLILCILLLYDGAYGNDRAQELHWRGMRDLVSLRGGIHNVTMALAYVVHADRACATRFEIPPTYVNPSARSLPMPMPTPDSLRYGARFRAMRASSPAVDRDVVEYLIDVSGLVESWEEQRAMSNNRRGPGLHRSPDFLHYTRDRLDEQFAMLNAQWAKVDTIERCLLWASRVIEYPCTWANYVEVVPRTLCHKLAEALQQQPDPLDLCQADLDLLVWLLFALTTAQAGLSTHSWAMEFLREALVTRHGLLPWSRTWWVDEQENLLKFVWSNSSCAGFFKNVCDDLEKHTHSVAGRQQGDTNSFKDRR